MASNILASSNLRIEQLQLEINQLEAENLMLKDTAAAVSGELGLDTVLQLVAERAQKLIQAETLLIPILDRQCEQYTYMAGCGVNADEIVGESMPLEMGVCGWVWENKRTWWQGVIDDMNDTDRALWEREGKNIMMVPLQGRHHFLGGISGIKKIGGDCFDKRDHDLLVAFAGMVSIAIENALYFEEVLAARKDAETYQGELVDLNTRLECRIKEAQKEIADSHQQTLQSEKLASVGQLAAGIAHEINTPIQFVGDNTRFLKDAFNDMTELIALYQVMCKSYGEGTLTSEMVDNANDKVEDIDFEYLAEEVPEAIDQSLVGIERVTTIVRSMKDFSHPGSDHKELVDINRSIESTITVCRNEWKYDAEIIKEFDTSLCAVPCYVGEFNQVVLNIVVNAAHAIHAARGESEALGEIKITTRLEDENAIICIADNGSGMPEEVRKRIFEPFYTTKGVGKGTGQGLAIAYTVIVDKHKGLIDVASEENKGTTFTISLPMDSSDLD